MKDSSYIEEILDKIFYEKLTIIMIFTQLKRLKQYYLLSNIYNTVL